MSVASYTTQLKAGGTATPFTDEPLIKYSDLIYRITDPIKRVLSPDHAVVVRDSVTNDVIVPASINYLDGVILLEGPEANALEIDGYYIPLSFIGGAKEYSLEIGGDMLDDTAFHSATEVCPGFRSRSYGLHDASLSFSRYNDLINTLRDKKLAKTPIFAKINPGGGKTLISGWFVAETDSLSGDIGALEEEAFSLALHGTLETSLSYIYDYTTVEAQITAQGNLASNYFPQKIRKYHGTNPNIPENLTIKEISLGDVTISRTGDANGYPAWYGNTVYVSRFDNELDFQGWTILDDNSLYSAKKESLNGTPIGLTAWTIELGSGQPVITGDNPIGKYEGDLCESSDGALWKWIANEWQSV